MAGPRTSHASTCHLFCCLTRFAFVRVCCTMAAEPKHRGRAEPNQGRASPHSAEERAKQPQSQARFDKEWKPSFNRRANNKQIDTRMGNSSTRMSAKNFDASMMPAPKTLNDDGSPITPEDAVIFNAGFVDVSGFAPNAVLVLTLSCEGYQDQVGTTGTIGLVDHAQRKLHPHMLQKAFTFALDKNCLPTAMLTLTVLKGRDVAAERKIPVRKLKYSGQKFFNDTIVFGALQGPGKNHNAVPTVKMAFELLSVGDGKIFIHNSPFCPKYMDLELASTPGSHGHPLTLATLT